MWKAYAKDGKIYQEGTDKWAFVRNKEIVRLECSFGSTTKTITIPIGCQPVFFNTGEAIIRSGKSVKKQRMPQKKRLTVRSNGRLRLTVQKTHILSQSIGYSNGEKEIFLRISSNGDVSREEGIIIH